MSEMLMSGIELMIVGMGIVFLFLAMLVIAVNIMSALVTRFLPEPLSVVGSVATVAKPDGIDPGVVAAISGALRQYRATHR